MTDLIPYSETTVEDRKSFYNAAVAALMEAIRAKAGYPEGDVVIRDALPKTDLGLTNEFWVNEVAQALNTWTMDWSKELGKTMFVSPYKVFSRDGSPHIIGIKYQRGTAGASVLAQLQIEDIYADWVPLGYMAYESKPLVWNGAETIYVALMADAAVPLQTEKLAHGLLIAEPVGGTISGPI